MNGDKVLEGRLSIYRIHNTDGESTVTIELVDHSSRTHCVHVVMGIGDFASCLMGSGEVPCTFKLWAASVGLKRLFKTLVVAFDEYKPDNAAEHPELIQAVAEGWRVNFKDLENGHRWNGNTCSVLCEKWVEPDTEEARLWEQERDAAKMIKANPGKAKHSKGKKP